METAWLPRDLEFPGRVGIVGAMAVGMFIPFLHSIPHTRALTTPPCRGHVERRYSCMAELPSLLGLLWSRNFERYANKRVAVLGQRDRKGSASEQAMQSEMAQIR